MDGRNVQQVLASRQAELMLQKLSLLTGLPTLTPDQIRGRWVWGCPADADAGKPGALHVEILTTDPIANDEAMASITPADMMSSSKERWKLYLKRRTEACRRLNDEAVEARGLTLLIRKSGEPTTKFEQMYAALNRTSQAEGAPRTRNRLREDTDPL